MPSSQDRAATENSEWRMMHRAQMPLNINNSTDRTLEEPNGESSCKYRVVVNQEGTWSAAIAIAMAKGRVDGHVLRMIWHILRIPIPY